MSLAVLDLSELSVLGILSVLGMTGLLMIFRRPVDFASFDERLRRMEDKINVLLEQSGIDYVPKEKERWQRLADVHKREEAESEYRSSRSASSQEAKRVVEDYCADS